MKNRVNMKKKEESLWDLWDTIKTNYIHIMGILGEAKETKNILRDSVPIACASNTIQTICRRHCHYKCHNISPVLEMKLQAFQIQPLFLNIVKRAILSQRSPLLLISNL